MVLVHWTESSSVLYLLEYSHLLSFTFNFCWHTCVLFCILGLSVTTFKCYSLDCEFPWCSAFYLCIFLYFLKCFLKPWAKVDSKLNATLLILKIHKWFFIVLRKYDCQPHLSTLGVTPASSMWYTTSSFLPGASPSTSSTVEIPWHPVLIIVLFPLWLSPWGTGVCQLSWHLLQYLNEVDEVAALQTGISGEGFALVQFPCWNKSIIRCLLD